uniref:Uncharacterized protein n=1 Tax=Avena sativa TaxID=4498 RepID=A0ACD5T994_AVESA
MLPSHCDNMLAYAAAAAERRAALIDPRRYRPNVEVAPNCPRCDSANTKFCYYNNYSLSQPRYFCKGCRRYWTKGGSLRNVPVGGGCRKNRRGKPVRSMAETVDVAILQGSTAPFSHRLQSPPAIRPDLLLEGMAGSPPDPEPAHQPASSDEPAGSADGSMIDLGLLYSKFLSSQPLAGEQQCAVVPESVDNLSGSSSPPALSDPSQHGFGGELCGPVSCTEPTGCSASAMLHNGRRRSDPPHRVGPGGQVRAVRPSPQGRHGPPRRRRRRRVEQSAGMPRTGSRSLQAMRSIDRCISLTHLPVLCLVSCLLFLTFLNYFDHVHKSCNLYMGCPSWVKEYTCGGIEKHILLQYYVM